MIGRQLPAAGYGLAATGATEGSSDRGLGGGLVGLGVAFLLCVLLMPLGIRLARRLGVIDRPVGDKIHSRPTPLMGGVAIAAAFLLTAGVWHAWSDLHRQPGASPNTALTGLLIGCALAALLGVVDELRTLTPRVHLLGQIGVVLVALLVGFPPLRQLSNPLVNPAQSGVVIGLLPPVGVLVTVFWIVGMMNTVNFLDGLDGLAGGVTAIAALFLGLWEVVVSNTYLPSHLDQNVILPLMLCGAILGFLVYNWAPARVFMGDSGAMFIGFSLGALSIFGVSPKPGTALLVLIVPILDVAWAIVRRLSGRRSFASGDKHHIYHRMLELGLSRRAVVLIFYGLCVALGLIDLTLYKRAKLAAFLAVAALASAGAVALEIRGRRIAARAHATTATAPGGELRLPRAER